MICTIIIDVGGACCDFVSEIMFRFLSYLDAELELLTLWIHLLPYASPQISEKFYTFFLLLKRPKLEWLSIPYDQSFS